MALADLDALKTVISAPNERVDQLRVSQTTAAGRMMSYWAIANGAGAAPTTAAAPTRSTTGAMGQQNGGSGRLILSSVDFNTIGNQYIWICDRLSHQGGLSGTVTTAQTTNLATAALTRYTSGVGVFAALEIYSQVGTTGTTVTASYTNQAGTAGQVSLATVFGGTGFREAGRMIILPLVAGDTGVKSVESVTVLASTTTAGNFGVTLFKPLYVINAKDFSSYGTRWHMLSGCCMQGEEIVDDACLWPVSINALSPASGFSAHYSFSEV